MVKKYKDPKFPTSGLNSKEFRKSTVLLSIRHSASVLNTGRPPGWGMRPAMTFPLHDYKNCSCYKSLNKNTWWAIPTSAVISDTICDSVSGCTTFQSGWKFQLDLTVVLVDWLFWFCCKLWRKQIRSSEYLFWYIYSLE